MLVFKIQKITAAFLVAAAVIMVPVNTRASVSKDICFSELTGEPSDPAIKNQRPIAAVVDNESIAYPHFGTAEGDVVYELINSTDNGFITRLMVLVKDWQKITQLGSIRSTRPTNIMLAGEWNAVLCHDGGPYFVNEYFAKGYASQHFSGGFQRVNNGKATEFTEYIMTGNLEAKFASSGYSTEYNEYAPERESHFVFAEYGTERDLSGYGIPAGSVELPFPHTSSALSYNARTGTYDYSAYGSLHKDAEDGQVLTFKNVLIQKCDYSLLDNHGYMVYNVMQEDMPGYYITDGYAQKITWSKTSENGLTKYYDENGLELEINRGKTYITLVPESMWDSMVIR